jgi:hypothetical protein
MDILQLANINFGHKKFDRFGPIPLLNVAKVRFFVASVGFGLSVDNLLDADSFGSVGVMNDNAISIKHIIAAEASSPHPVFSPAKGADILDRLYEIDLLPGRKASGFAL